MRKNKLFLLAVSTLAVSCVAAGMAKVGGGYAAAENVSFTIEETASVKLMDTAEESGIRFTFNVVGTAFEAMLDEEGAFDGVTVGAIIAPADVAATTALTWTNATATDSVLAYQEITADKWLKGEDGNYSTFAYLYGLPAEYYNRAISAVGVIQEGTSEDTCTYTEVTTKSMAEVAVAALADESQDWTDEEKALIGGYVLDYDVVIKDGETTLATVPVKYGTTLVSDADYVAPTKAGYVFDGFDGYDTTAVVTGATTVSAKWLDVSANLGFDTEASVKLITSGGALKPTFVDDAQTASGKAAQFTLRNEYDGDTSYINNNITINLGSKYKVKDIATITVGYKIVEAGTDAQWFRTSINSFEYYDSYKMVTASVSGGSAGNATMSSYGTITVTREEIITYLEATSTGDENTVINDIRFWAQGQPVSKGVRYSVWNIDYVEIAEYTPLQFNVLKEGSTNEYVLMDVANAENAANLSNTSSSFSIADGKMTYVPTASWASGYTQYNLPEAINVSDIGVIKVVAKSSKPVLIYIVDETGATAYTCLWRNYNDASDHIRYSETIDEAGRTTYWISVPSAGIAGNQIKALRFGTNTANSSNEIYEVTYFKPTAACNALISGSTTQYNLVDYTKEAEQASVFATSRSYREGFTSSYSSAGLTVTTGQYGNCYACFFTPIRVKLSEIDTYTFVVSSNANTFRLMAGVQTGSVEFTADSEGVTVTDNGDGTKTVTVDVSTLTFVTFASGAWTTTAGTATYITGVEIYGGAAKTYTVKSISYTKATA